MGLISIAELAPLLACPVCGVPVNASETGWHCTSGHKFASAGGQPVLVDFNQSILAADEVKATGAASTIKRGASSGLKKTALRFLMPHNEVAALNARHLIKMMPNDGVLLVIGGADMGTGADALYEDLQVIAFDIYGSSLTQFVADAHQIPLVTGSIDAVWIQAVLEHVLDPWVVAEEIHRVLKPDGIIYAETPFLQPVHEGAYDFTRFTASGHRWLFRRFEEIKSGVAMGTTAAAVSSLEMLARGLFRSVKTGVIVKATLFWIQKLERIIPRKYSQDSASAVFFLGKKTGIELAPRDMVAYYNGAFKRR